MLIFIKIKILMDNNNNNNKKVLILSVKTMIGTAVEVALSYFSYLNNLILLNLINIWLSPFLNI